MMQFGPAGTGGNTYEGLQLIAKKGLNACEIEFVYGVKMQNSLAKQIGELNKKLKLSLSVHCPYYINLNSADKQKVIMSKRRILESCERAHYMGAKYIVFHPGFYGKDSKEKAFENIKKEILDLQRTIKQKEWDVVLCPETTGKISQFGDLDELIKMSKETNCGVCIDFAHLLARSNGKMSYDEMAKKAKQIKIKTSHFSGITWTDKGERMHKITPDSEIKNLLKALKKYKIDIRIINESPDPIGDALRMQKAWKTI